MPTKSISLLFTAVALFALTEGCSCVPQTLPQHYERAKTVVKAQLIKVTVSPTPTPPPCLTQRPPCLLPIRISRDRKFTFRLKRIFKGCPPGGLFLAKSYTDDGICGIRLKQGSTFLLFLDDIAPDVDGLPDSFNLDGCQGNRRFNRVQPSQRAFLRRASKLKKNGCLEEQ